MQIEKKFLVFLFGLPLLFLSACTTQTSQYIHSDGSVVMKQEVDIYEYFKATMEDQWTEEDNEGELNLEEAALISAIGQAEEMCSGHAEQEYQDFEPEEIFSICEVADDGKVIFYNIFSSNYVDYNKTEEFYEYSLVELLGESYSEGPDLGENSKITLFFDNDIIHSDIGTVSGNEVLISWSDWTNMTDDESQVVRVKIVNGEENYKKSLSTFNIELEESKPSGKLSYSLHRKTNQQELSPYFRAIEQAWGLSVSELKKKICPQYSSEESRSNIYIPNIQTVNCDIEHDVISVETSPNGLGGLSSFSEHNDYYSFSLMTIISMDSSIIDKESFKNHILPYYSDNSEFYLFFDREIIATDLGEKDGGKLILSWDDVQNINKDSSVKISKNNLINTSTPTETNSDDNTQNEYSINNQTMYNSLKGKIVLKVESKGEAYYVHPTSKKMYFLGRPNDAFSVMREQGIGISNVNLARIPVALDNLFGLDSDGDDLPDVLEVAIGTNPNNKDSDGDGYDDYTELLNGYNPLGSGLLSYDLNFAKTQAGKIFLQVERNGEAWYVNSVDNKRYFLSRPADAFSVMRNLGLGISNENFEKLK